ncbi:ABC transporter substrate-binding protein [Mangrovibrevibacter kandeliae]|uniref:ABC transporter substrate-binding protein n=1 Tax=Mangrovibrevibacter kandeliae TaxID=2968473 RepID=UPI002117C3AF|nr:MULTISPECIES: ABC transporter substrate-binding protein [unclassified Aurantimonas]MCQ8781328.1 ABC transporter substrate-binding protein [Aurantimonas sp. CSK15Z-1]MCW4114110.1 ABC transporter substrate-binding protein [Aurantimonas sp. MSK8Z-1]
MNSLKLAVLAAGLLATTAAASAQTLRVGLAEDPDALDPHKARTYVGRIVFTSLCDKLVDISPKLDFVPQLATEWSYNDDQTELTFKLRDGVTFQDGSKFDGDAVKANIERAMTLPDSNRRSELSSVDHVEVVDPSTVKFVLKQPDATLLATLSDRAGMMLAPTAFAEGKEFSQNPICSGPYKFVRRVQNDRIELTKYDGYWDAKDYPIEGVTFLPIVDSTVKLANLRSGDIDMLERLAPNDVPSVKGDAALQFVPVTGLGYSSIRFNTNNGSRAENPIGKDKRVRQAFQLAVDRDVINEIIGNGIFPPAQQPFPPSSPYHSDKFPPVTRDVEKAKALLKEAGVEHPSFELDFGTGSANQQFAELVQAMAAEAGFDIKLRATEFAAMQKEMEQGNFDAALIGWSGRVDPDGNIHQFATCKGNLNDSKYCNEEVDKALNAARRTSDVEERKALYDEAQTILQDDLPLVYTYYQPWPFVLSQKVKGFEAYPDGMIRLKGMSLGD